MDSKRRLALAIVKHLKTEIVSGTHTDEIGESLEVAVQCLEEAYNIKSDEDLSGLDCGKSLIDIFNDGLKAPEASVSQKAIAEQLKIEGNDQMKSGLYQEAVDTYTKAIQIDSNNAVYYSNRAAAFTKLGENQKAIDDCKVAAGIDPNFSRAYGRMGLAQMNIEKLSDAKESYKKALSLDPENSGYKQNLEIIEQKLAQNRGGPTPAGFPNLGGLDIGSLLSNPAVMNMAQSFMQNPQMQQMFSNMMGGGGAGEPEVPEQSNSSPATAQPSLNFQDILGATQTFAEQMQRDNPELTEQLRSQFKGANPDSEKENK